MEKEITLYARMCKGFYGELDRENVQLYTEAQLKDEAVAIDYVDGDEVENMDINDLMEVFARNDELVIEAGTFIPS